MSTSQNSLALKDSEALAQPLNPMQMVAAAVQQGASIDIVERLVALQERMQARDAETAFNVAMNEAQEAMAPVRKDLDNPHTSSRYASYKALDQMVRPIYSRHGFALSFDTADATKDECIRVVCYVTHNQGHSRTYHVDMPADGKGAKGGDVMTKTHATGAAASYGMRYLLRMIWNIAVGEDDNDGNEVKMSELPKHLECIRGAANMDDLVSMYRAALKIAVELADGDAIKELNAARTARKSELEKSGK